MIKRNKNFEKLILSLGMLVCFSSCELLQNSLSSVQEEKLAAETGVASLNGKVWFYNGIIDDNISLQAYPSNEEFTTHSLLVNFGKKVAANDIFGSLEVTYTDSDGAVISKTLPKFTGAFTSDYTGYKVNMNDVVKLLDKTTIPSGTATLNLKIGGFVCAEGEQTGRSISTLEVNGIQIKPLYSTTETAFSTKNFAGTSAAIELELNGEITLEGGEYDVVGKVVIPGAEETESTYAFTVKADGRKIIFVPKFTNPPADGTVVKVCLENILPLTCGDSFTKEIKLLFSRGLIVIDGKIDENYKTDDVLAVTDDTGDLDGFGDQGWSLNGAGSDIQKIYIVNDEEYLYVGVEGNHNLTWNDSLNILVSNGKVTGGSGARSAVPAADTQDFTNNGGRTAKVQPNVYLTHQPGSGNTGDGSISVFAYKNSVNTDITSNVKAAPKGWTSSSTGNFLEYAIPLADSGLSSGEKLSIIICGANVWNPTCVVDCYPNNAVTYNNADHSDVTFNFANGISYILK